MLAAYAEGMCLSSRNTPQGPTLPPELLSQIFRDYVRMSPPYNPREVQGFGQICVAEHLLLVCKSWHNAASADSALWREIIFDPETVGVAHYKSLLSYVRVRSIRSRMHLLHVTINNTPVRHERPMYLKAHFQLVKTMSRWERLVYYFNCLEASSYIRIRHLADVTPHLREVVIADTMGCFTQSPVLLSGFLPKTPNLRFLEISISGISLGPFPASLLKSVKIASLQIFDIRAWKVALSQFKSIHTLILRPPHAISLGIHDLWQLSVEMPSVHTLILVGPFSLLHLRLQCISLPALRTLEVDLSPSVAEKQWSDAAAWSWQRIKGLLNTGLHKLVLKSVRFDQWQDMVEVFQDADGCVEELVCIDVTCTLHINEEQKVDIDLSATLLQQGMISPASLLSILDGLRQEHGVK